MPSKFAIDTSLASQDFWIAKAPCIWFVALNIESKYGDTRYQSLVSHQISIIYFINQITYNSFEIRSQLYFLSLLVDITVTRGSRGGTAQNCY